MRYLLALLFPWAVFFTMGKIGQGILCLLLQLTIIGWLPATIWAFISIGGYHADQRTDRRIDRWIERRIAEVVADLPVQTDQRQDPELVALSERLALANESIEALRALLASLRERRSELRAA
jgi:uncharacterized membrane protein YqaE (UPF0057 family)